MKAQDKRGKRHAISFQNRRAGFDIAVEERLEAGLVLTSDEIKSVRAERVQLQGGFIKFIGGKPVVIGLHLSEAKEPERSRPLLLHAKEVAHVQEVIQRDGMTAVPLRLYLKRGWAKLEIGLGKGRKQHDKRDLIKQRDLDRDLRRGL